MVRLCSIGLLSSHHAGDNSISFGAVFVVMQDIIQRQVEGLFWLFAPYGDDLLVLLDTGFEFVSVRAKWPQSLHGAG